MTFPILNSTFPFQWETMTPEHIVPDTREALRISKENISKIKSLSLEECTFENVIRALDNAIIPAKKMEFFTLLFTTFLGDVEEYRNQQMIVSPEMSDFSSSLYTDIELFQRVEYVYNSMNNNLNTNETQNTKNEFDDDMKRLTNETYENFVNGGCQLKGKEKERFQEISKELNLLCQTFAKNVVNGKDKECVIVTDENELVGIPESVKTMLKKEAEKSNVEGWKISMKFQSYYPIMKYAKNSELRKQVYLKNLQVCSSGEFDNTQNIIDMLKYRQEYAELLHCENFSEMVTKRRMARSGSNALKFVEDLHDKVQPFFEKDIETIRQLKKEMCKEENSGDNKEIDDELYPWDITYYNNILRQKEYQYDPDELKQYFTEENVMKGMFAMYNKLYGITFEYHPEIKGWHKDVKFYNIIDNNNELLGGVYFDLYARNGKKNGAWEECFIEQYETENGEKIIPMAYIGTDFAEPIDGVSKFSLNDVETIFHESGHLIHNMFIKTKYRSLGLYTVPWDFIELPSQVMENWVYERETLDLITGTEEGKRIPDELYDKMMKAKNFMSGVYLMGQLRYGKMDLELHQKYLASGKQLDEFIEEVTKEYRVNYNVMKTMKLTNGIDVNKLHNARVFTHLFNETIGYASGYYSYMWAKCIDADAFEYFKEKGIFNKEIAELLRRKVLEMGNRKPADELYRDFRGRDPDSNAVLKQYGLL